MQFYKSYYPTFPVILEYAYDIWIFFIITISWSFSEYQQYQDAGTEDDGEFLEDDEEEIPEDDW